MVVCLVVAVSLLLVAGAGARSNPHGHVTVLTAPGAGTYLGRSVALSANATTALVGDPSTSAAWIFRRVLGGVWTGGTRIAGSPSFGEAFAMSADGRTMVIGAPLVGDRGGAAWVYTNRGGGVMVSQRLRPTGLHPHYHEQFGDAVAISADASTILVGAPADGAPDTGAVWAFARSGSTWKQQGSKMLPKSVVGGGQFGTSLALSSDGNFALVGGPGDNGLRGAVWALHRASGRWSQTKIALSFLNPKDELGSNLALSADGHLGLVSRPGQSPSAKGAVEIFTRLGTTWTRRTYLAEFEAIHYGGSVALSGDGMTAFIGGGFTGGGPNDPNVRTWVLRRGPTATSWHEIDQIRNAGDISASSNGEVELIGNDVYAFGPAIDAVAPGGGPTSGGTRVTIRGKDFKDVRWVQFGDVRTTTFTVDSPTQVTAVSPPSSPGVVRVTVVTTNTVSQDTGIWGYNGQFAYIERPAVSAVSPRTGSTAGGATVTITGQNFSTATGVRFGTTAAQSFKVDSATSITAVSPPGQAGPVDVTVTTLGGTSPTGAADAFTYVAPVASEKVITFDDLATGGPEGAGSLVTVNSQYAAQGATFNGPSAIDYSKGPSAIPDFARSGTVAVEQCVGIELCTTPIQATFNSPQALVRVWVGFSFRLNDPLTIQLRALGASGSTLGTVSTTLAASTSPTPIRTPLEISVSSALIKSIEISVPGGYMNGVAVDHITFSGGTQ
jgi:IPT/TIG domain